MVTGIFGDIKVFGKNIKYVRGSGDLYLRQLNENDQRLTVVLDGGVKLNGDLEELSKKLEKQREVHTKLSLRDINILIRRE